MKPTDTIGDIDVSDDVQFLALCERVRQFGRAAAIQISYAADEIRGLLAEMPEHPAAARTSKQRAALVAGHIQTSADAFHAAAVSAARAAGSFRKHYENELAAAYGKAPTAKKHKFKVGG